jgi:segregation and condensation protein A
MAFSVKTTVFEGPIDLLLQLITKHQLEVTAIGLTEVVEEYVALLNEMKEMDLDVTSEFLLIASTLVQLKARSLLPGRGEMDLDDEIEFMEERDRLLSRLLACVTFKDVSAVVQRRLHESNRFVPRVSGIDQTVKSRPNVVQLPVDIDRLAGIAARVFERQSREPDLDHLDLELPSVEDAIVELRERVSREIFADFDELVSQCNRTVEVAAYFLAMLELARWGLIEVSQEDWSSGIEIRHRSGSEVDLTSEWTGS